MELPITLRPKSELKSDIAVARVDPNEYGDPCGNGKAARHPTPVDVFLILEVADSTLLNVRQQKALIYAKAGILYQIRL